MLKIIVFCPKSDIEKLITAMTDAGAGTIGKYSGCAFVTKGIGYWKPEKGANPTVGKVEEVSYEEQYRLEMVCAEDRKLHVITAIKKAHSYETPEINIVQLVDAEG